MFDEIKSIKSSKKELRSFGIVMGVALAVFGGFFFWRGKEYYVYLFGIAAFFLFFGFGAPIVLKPVQKIWMSLAVLLSWIVTRVILIILFYAVVTPISIIARICGKDFLDVSFDKDKNTYWRMRTKGATDKQQYEKQF